MPQSQIAVKKEPTTESLWAQSTIYEDEVSEDQAPRNFGGPLPKFKWLVENLLEKLNKIQTDNQWYTNQSKRERKLQVVDKFITEWRTTVGPNIYPALRLVLPPRDRERTYNIKDLKLGKYLLEILKIPKKSIDYEHIMNWKQFTRYQGQWHRQDQQLQRMSTVCVELLKKRKQDIDGGIFTIDQVNDILDNLAHNESQKPQQLEIFNEVLKNMSFIELQYFFDILLKNRIDKGMENSILYYWHPDAVDYLSAITSLRAVCYKLSDPTRRLNKSELSINLGKPFKPQLSKKLAQNYSKISEILKHDFYIEEKMDGERIQVHYMDNGKNVRYYSRKAMDYTFIYGDSTQWGCISPHLKFVPNVRNCVLDGEMVTYDPQRDSFVPFGVLKGSAIEELKKLNSGQDIPEKNTNARPFLMVFDLVFLNGVTMAQYPLHKRKEFLSKILTPEPGYVEIIKTFPAKNEEEIKKSLSHAVERGSEGIILKQHDSTYQIDKRIDSWVKIKPEYLEEFGENVDLVVIGREKSKKDKFLCGLRVTDNDLENSKQCTFYSFCRVSNGFDSDDYRKIEDLTKGKWKDMKLGDPPSDLIQFGKRLPTEWIDPRESFVIEVKARSIDRSISKNYKTSTTLYNAYHRQIRTDKDWKDSTTVEDYRQMKDSRRSVNDKAHKILSRKKRLIVTQVKKQSLDEENWNDLSSSVKSNIFEGLTFMVLSDSFQGHKRLTIDEISTILKQNGATITKNQHLVKDLTKLRIITDKRTIEAKELHRDGFDTIRSSWVFDCLRNQKVIKLEPKHCYDVGFQMLMKSGERVNRFDISYLNKLNPNDLEKLFDKVIMKNDAGEILQGCEQGEEDAYDWRELNDVILEGSFFYGLRPYLVTAGDIVDDIDGLLLKNQIEMNDGTVVDSVKDSNLIVVLHCDDPSVIRKVSQVRKELAGDLKFSDDDCTVSTKRIVNDSWIRDTIKNGFRGDEQDYPVLTARVHNVNGEKVTI